MGAPADGVRRGADQPCPGDDSVEFRFGAQAGAVDGEADEVCFAVVFVQVIEVVGLLDQQHPAARGEVLSCAAQCMGRVGIGQGLEPAADEHRVRCGAGFEHGLFDHADPRALLFVGDGVR